MINGISCNIRISSDELYGMNYGLYNIYIYAIIYGYKYMDYIWIINHGYPRILWDIQEAMGWGLLLPAWQKDAVPPAISGTS